MACAESRLLAEEEKHKGVEFRGIEFFEDILDKIGSRGGKFQKQLMALVGLCAFLIMHASTNHLYATYVPDHWCQVPGRELTNLSLEEWKNITLPQLTGRLASVRCEGNESESVAVPCQHGWDYESRWFSVTIPVDQNWVCDDALRMPNALFISGLLCTFLVLFMCYSGDRFGRKVQYVLSFSVMAGGRTLTAFTPSIYGLYIAVLAIATAGMGSSYECAISMGLEMSSADSRNTVNSIGIFSSAFGKMSCALIAWHLPHYMHMLLATSLPLFIPLLFICWIPESPRWLTGKGRYREAFQVLQRVAKVNGKQLPQEVMETLHKMSERRNAKFGIISLATNRSLRKNTLIIVLSRFVTVLTTTSLSYNLGNVPMNPYLMQIAFASIDVPSVFLSHFMGEKIGRRWSHCIFVFLAAVSCGILILITAASPSTLGIGCVTVILNMMSNCALYVCYLQSMEIHPTCVRQSAGAVETFFMAMAATLSPYMAHLHVLSGGWALYGVVGSLLLVTTVVASFLPETLYQKLPETLEDADNFGSLARYWSFPSRKDKDQPPLTTTNGDSKHL